MLRVTLRFWFLSLYTDAYIIATRGRKIFFLPSSHAHINMETAATHQKFKMMEKFRLSEPHTWRND
jgi:hypothetical protein